MSNNAAILAFHRPRLFDPAADAQDSPCPCDASAAEITAASYWRMELTATHCRVISERNQDAATVVSDAPILLPPMAVHLPPIAWNAVEAATTNWVDSIELAGLAGHPYSGHWRSIVAALVRAGYLERQQATKKLRRGPREYTPADGK